VAGDGGQGQAALGEADQVLADDVGGDAAGDADITIVQEIDEFAEVSLIGLDGVLGESALGEEILDESA
jgi:hypothetical protein